MGDAVTEQAAGGRAGATRALFGRGGVYMLGTAGQMLAALAVLPLVTRILTAREFGLVATALVVTQIVRVLAEGGLPAVVTLDYFGTDGPARARRLAGSTMVFATVVTTLVHVSGPVWSPLLLDLGYDHALTAAVWCALPLAGLVAAQAVLRAEQRAGAFVMSAVIGSVVSQGLGVLVITLVEATAAWYLVGVLVGQTLAFLVAAAGARPHFDGWRRHHELPPALRLAWPAVPHGLSLFLLQAGDRIVVQRVDGLDAAGRYQAAYVIGALGISVLGAVNNAWTPLVFGEYSERRWSMLADTTSILVRLAGLGAAATALVAPLALLVVAPADYRPDDLVAVTAIVSASAVPYCLYLSRVSVLFVNRRPAVLAVVTPTVAVLSIVANLVLVPMIGLVGAALTTLAAYSLQAAVVRHVVATQVRVPWRTGATRQAVLVAALGVAAGLALPAQGWALGLRLSLAAALGARMVSTIRREWHQ